MRTVQSILDFFFETPQAYFCDRCGECHRAGECKAVEEPTQREPKAEEKRADEFKEEVAPREPKEGTLPRKPRGKRKRRIHKKKEKKRGSSRSLWARRGRDRVRRPGRKTGISGMMRTRLDEEGLSPPHRTHEARPRARG
jgi:hypothetical protein